MTGNALPPPWGEYVRVRRQRQGRSIRQAALVTDLSNSYWGQVERGYQTVKGQRRIITPSRATLLAMAESLRLTGKETNELLALAGQRPTTMTDGSAPRGSDVDLTDLSRNDITLLNAIADRFRATRSMPHESDRLAAVAANGDPRDADEISRLAIAERQRQVRKP